MEKFINVKRFPLVFVQNAAGDGFTVYQDGKEVRGIRSIRIDAGVEEFTTHEIEYVTGATAEEKWEGNGGKSGWIFEDSPQKSANERRKQAIEKAKRFVAKIQSESDNGRNKEGGNRTYRILSTKSEFIVNEKKRTIVALVRGVNSGTLFEKGIAKCAPTDVFNEHIGKAIALGRAYGLDVSEFEQAPQPDEVVYGMVVRGNGEGTTFYRRDRSFTIDGKNGDKGFYYEESELYSGGKYDYILSNQIGDIISDTEAQY